MPELLSLIKSRQSSRIPFDENKPVSQEDILQILEAGSWAPTAHNMQNFEVIIVDDKELLDEIRDMELPVSETFIRENYLQLSFTEEELKKKKTGVLGTMFPKAWLDHIVTPAKESDKVPPNIIEQHNQIYPCPTLLVILYNPQKRAPASEGDFLGIMSLGCVLENMWLMATSLGLSVHALSSLNDDKAQSEIKDMLNIPEHLKIALSFRIGYPTSEAKYTRVRRDLSDFVHRNNYSEKSF